MNSKISARTKNIDTKNSRLFCEICGDRVNEKGVCDASWCFVSMLDCNSYHSLRDAFSENEEKSDR